MVENRYLRNMNMLSAEDISQLKDCKACVLGCGGLGGYIIEMLARLGIGYITAVDGDNFEETNLNRQLLSDIESLGKNKAAVAKERMAKVNPLINATARQEMFTADNAENILAGHDIVVDALDNLDSRFLLQDIAKQLSIPIVHGAVAGWYGKITTIFPGDDTFDKLYRRDKQKSKGIEMNFGTPSFIPAVVAGIQVSEVVKVLLGKGIPLRHKLLYLDLQINSNKIIDCSFPQTDKDS